ncbi:MAG: hypothetical protein KGS48_01705 [Bacteroidetes bacterium]|nr:hypothetical protein [Bacteroidota bacterium]
MSFTRSTFFAGQQAQTTHCSDRVSLNGITEKNWRLNVYPAAVGNPGRQAAAPGCCRFANADCSKTGKQMGTQSLYYMKNQSIQPGFDPIAVSQNGNAIQNTPNEPINEEIELIEKKVFSTPPAPRVPESPEVESLRMLLKSNLSRHSASPALKERIRLSMLSENRF